MMRNVARNAVRFAAQTVCGFASPVVYKVAGPAAICGVVALLSVGGCAAYRLGNASLFRSDIRTIYVPMIRNDTFRHDLGPMLTESLVREIQRRTPYQVIGDVTADSTLIGRVTSESKAVLTETDSDDPRALDFAVSVSVTWTDRAGNVLMQNTVLPTTAAVASIADTSRLVPEAGQSVATAQMDVADDLARQIVSRMELRW